MAVYNHIVKNNFYDFGTAITPTSTISAVLGDFIRNSDSRVKRIKEKNGSYSYYLTKNEQSLEIESVNALVESDTKKINKAKTYEERDLHRLLSSYLKNIGVYSKT